MNSHSAAHILRDQAFFWPFKLESGTDSLKIKSNEKSTKRRQGAETIVVHKLRTEK